LFASAAQRRAKSVSAAPARRALAAADREPSPELLDAAMRQAERTAVSSDQAGDAATAASRRRRKRLFLLLAALLVKTGGAYATYAWWTAGDSVSTDNAYAAAETAQVTPAIAGIVREIPVADTQAVRTGDVVVVLDATDAQLALGSISSGARRW